MNDHPNSTQAAYAALKADILAGRYAAGERIKESVAAEALGLSRTPIRRALRRLAADGYVELPPNRSAQVIGWSEREAREIMELRAVLESFGAGVAARKVTPAALKELDHLAAQMEEAVASDRLRDLHALTTLNSRFHMAVVQAAGNARLTETIVALAHPLLIQQRFSNYDRERLQRSMSHHREIVAALRAGDAEWASAIMRSHILAGRSRGGGEVLAG